MTDTNWLALNFTTWVEILLHLRDESDHRRYDIIAIIRMLSTCRTLRYYADTDEIWFHLCKTFNDFESRLRARQTTTRVSWAQIYRDRITSVLIERNMSVGDPGNPEYELYIKIFGNGTCSMYKRSYVALPKAGGMKGLCSEIENMVELNIECGTTRKSYFIDVHVYKPFVLLLRDDGRVMEMIFAPYYIKDFAEFEKPNLVTFPGITANDDRTRFVRALPVGNFAVSESDCLYVWSIIDHPVNMNKIRTSPLHIEALDVFLGKYDILESPDVPNHTRVCYRECIGRDPMTGTSLHAEKYLDIPNDQLYEMILSDHFTDEEFDEFMGHAGDFA